MFAFSENQKKSFFLSINIPRLVGYHFYFLFKYVAILLFLLGFCFYFITPTIFYPHDDLNLKPAFKRLLISFFYHCNNVNIPNLI